MTEKPESIGLDNKSPLERDRIDLNHEISGVLTGRIQRFLSDDSYNIYGESEKKKAENHYHSMLEMLLTQDAQYRALYSQVTQTLENAYQAVDKALIDINQRLGDSGRKLQLLRDNAPELEDGTKLFKSSIDNSVYTEDGKRLNDTLAQNIAFSKNSPNWEEYQAEKDIFDTATQQKLEVETYQHDVLDHAREKLNDEENPLLLDELKELESSIHGAPAQVSAAHDTVNKPKLNTPDEEQTATQNHAYTPDQFRTLTI